jgi:hypothetical protein
MTTYRVAIVMQTPYNPSKWDWDELIASEPGEQVLAVTVAEVEDTEPTLYWSDLANMTHERQVALFGWCSCEDSEAPYDDCVTKEQA